jgi:YHS domain-containing protein
MTWFFSSPENRDLFAAAPEKYAPQFGGFCALSVADGKNSRGSGEAWTVHEGKLYLNANKTVMATFRTDPNRWIAKAEGWWPTVKSRLEKE